MRVKKFTSLTSFAASCGGGGGGTTTPISTAVIAADPLAPQVAVNLADAATTLGFIDDGTLGGGGDGGGDSGAGGGAGDGAPLKKAVVVVVDASGKSVTGLTDNNGIYLVKFSNFKSPIVAKVIDAGGNILTSVTEETAAPGKVVRININPLTDKIVSDVVVSSAVPGTDKNFDGSKIDVSKLTQAKKDLIASISAALTSVGVTSTVFDPIKSVYAYDGTGVDTIVESITHTRDAQSGRTILRPKLVSVDTAITLEVSAATPLSTSAVSATNSAVLTYAKLNNWVNTMNACLALDPNTLPNKTCTNFHSMVSTGFLQSSMDFDESFKTLVSASCGTSPTTTFCQVQGSKIKNPVLLFVGKYAGSTASYDDQAVVEFTINQPSIGNYYGGGFSSPVEYTKIAVFRRDDSLTGAAAGNWILNGNQRTFDFSAEARYEKYTQNNPARAGNSGLNTTTRTFTLAYNPTPTANITASLPAGTYSVTIGTTTTSNNSTSGLDDPSTYTSGIRLNFDPTKFDPITRQWVSANVVAVKMTGPGLPAAGLVMAPNRPTVCGGDGYLAIANASGSMPTTSATFYGGFATNTYRLASVLASDGVTPVWYTTNQGAFSNRAKPNLTDFSPLAAFNVYRADIFLTNGTTVTEFTRILAPVESPTNLVNAQWNDISPSSPLVSSPALNSPASSFNVLWANNPAAAYVETVLVGSGAWVSNSSYLSWDHTIGVQAASALSTRPTSQSSGYPTDPNCIATGSTQFPAMRNVEDRRTIGVRTYQGRARRYNTVGWKN